MQPRCAHNPPPVVSRAGAGRGAHSPRPAPGTHAHRHRPFAIHLRGALPHSLTHTQTQTQQQHPRLSPWLRHRVAAAGARLAGAGWMAPPPRFARVLLPTRISGRSQTPCAERGGPRPLTQRTPPTAADTIMQRCPDRVHAGRLSSARAYRVFWAVGVGCVVRAALVRARIVNVVRSSEARVSTSCDRTGPLAATRDEGRWERTPTTLRSG